MPDTRLLIEIDGDALSDEDLPQVAEVQAEEAWDQADALTLTARLEALGDGEWTSVLDPLVTPRTKVAVQVARGDTLYRFEGFSTEAGWTIDADGSSTITVKAVDRTLELDAEEKVVAWPGTSDSDIAQAIFADHDLTAQVEPTPAGPDPDVHIALQRGTDWAFLRALAEKWGYAVYLESDGRRLVGHFHSIDPLADPQGELSLGFGDARKAQVDARLVAGRRIKAARIPALSDEPQAGDASGDDQAQGSASLGGQATVLLAPTDVVGEVEPLAAATGLARESAFAVHLTTEIDTDAVGLMLRARRTVLVKGLGKTLSGRYLVSRVRHSVTTDRHVQQLSLVRNALGLKGDEPFGGGLLGGLL